MANPYSLLEWTYSVRELRSTSEPDLLVGVDAADTPIDELGSQTAATAQLR